jgi:phosphatidylglycerophosphate synthase
MGAGPGVGLAGQVVVLSGLDVAVGLEPVGWLVGACCGLLTAGLLGSGLARSGSRVLGPADRVTLFRATLVGGVAALVADSLGGTQDGDGTLRVLVTMTVVALILDWVDGQVARRTRTASELGARFDMEVDALLILVLSVYAARPLGAWVLLIGAARYLRLLACLPWSWMRREAPPRYWGKVVAATQGVVLTVAVAGVLPVQLTVVLAAAALGLLAESFGREVWWLRRHRRRDHAAPARLEPIAASAGRAAAA